LLNERKQIVIQQAVTKGLDPNVKMKDSGVEWIGQIPEHWKLRKLSYLGVTQNGISGGRNILICHPFVSYGDVYKNRQLPLSVDGLAKYL
jgi:type I restriction enzyme S subunit